MNHVRLWLVRLDSSSVLAACSMHLLRTKRLGMAVRLLLPSSWAARVRPVVASDRRGSNQTITSSHLVWDPVVVHLYKSTRTGRGEREHIEERIFVGVRGERTEM